MRVCLPAVVLSLVFFPLAAFSQGGPPETGLTDQGQQPFPDLKKIRRSYNPFVFSEGYILGHVNKESVEGTIWEGFEGEVLLGLDSVPGGVIEDECVNKKMREMQEQEQARTQAKDKSQSKVDMPQLREQAIDQCMIRINPFPISSYSTEWQDRLNKIRATVDLSLIRFKGVWFHPLLASPYFIRQVIPVKDYPLPTRSLNEIDQIPFYRSLHYGTSQVEGRAVIASMDGIIRKHFHVIVQSGVGAGKFVHIEVPTASLFDYIVKCMASGKLIRIYYVILYNPQAYPSNLLMGYGTGLRAYRVDVLGQ